MMNSINFNMRLKFQTNNINCIQEIKSESKICNVSENLKSPNKKNLDLSIYKNLLEN